MIFINDKPSDIKEEDSDEVVLLKISQALNTIPENVIILTRTRNNISTTSVEKEIERLSKSRRTSPLSEAKRIILEQNDEIPVDNIKYEYIIFSKEKYNRIEGGDQILKMLLTSQGIDVNTVDYNTDSYKREKASSIVDIGATLNKQKEKAKEIESIKGISHTDFEVDLVTYYIEAVYTDYNYAPSDIYALDLFANSKISDNVPYMELKHEAKKYYKLKEHIPDIKIKEDTDEYSMFFMVSDGVGSYTPVFFEFDPVKAVFKIIFNAIQQRRHELVIKNVINALPPITHSEQKELSVRGTVIFQDINVNYLVFADMVLNNPLFSKRLYIDESSAVVSQKTRLNIHYKLPDDNKILFMVTNEETPNKYLHVRISKAPNKETVNEFSNMMGKLLTQYIMNEEAVVEFYESFGIDLTERERRLIRKKKEPITRTISKVKALSKEVPDLFAKHYARRCQKEKQPTIIEPSEIEQYEGDNYEVMEFPQGDDPNKRYYICDNDPYLFPGLQTNTLSNKEQYPYIPCCFSDSQISVPRSKYNEYVSGLDPEKRERKDISHMITILKVIDTPYRLAKLPDEVSTWLSELLDDQEYFRMGTLTGPINFIHAVLAAVDEEYNSLNMDEKITYVNNFLKSINDTINLEAAKQSNYELSMDQLTAWWLDPTKYHDALRFVRLMEIAFKIKIIIISPEQILVPRFIKFYARTPLNSEQENVILLFNHYGSLGVDALKFAHNEVIVNKSGNAIFNGMDAQKIYDAYEKAVTFTQIIDSGIVTNTPTLKSVEITQALIFSQPHVLTPKFQYIDGYGKARAVVFDFDGKTTILQITPSMPFNLESIPLHKIADFEYLDDGQAIDLINKLGGEILGLGASVNGFWFYVGMENARYFVPTSSAPQSPHRYLSYETLWDGLEHKNKIKELRKSRQHANILLSFFYYLLKLNKLSPPLTMDNANKFVENNTILIENHQYAVPDKRILPIITSDKAHVLDELNNFPTYIRDSRLIITSNEMKNRLVGLLKSSVYISQGDKIFKIILVYLEYLLKLYNKSRPMLPGEIESFINRNIVVINEHRYYEINPVLPELGEDIVKIKDSLHPNYFDKGQLILNSNDMKKTIIKILSSTLELGDVEVLNGYYEYNYDFPVKSNELVFIGDTQFRNYIKFSTHQKDYLSLYAQTKTDPMTEFPYVMKFPEFYGFVQNTYLGTLEAALSVGLNWYNQKYNTGFDTPELEFDFDEYDGTIIEYQIIDGEWHEQIIHITADATQTLYVLSSGEFYSAVIKV